MLLLREGTPSALGTQRDWGGRGVHNVCGSDRSERATKNMWCNVVLVSLAAERFTIRLVAYGQDTFNTSQFSWVRILDTA